MDGGRGDPRDIDLELKDGRGRETRWDFKAQQVQREDKIRDCDTKRKPFLADHFAWENGEHERPDGGDKRHQRKDDPVDEGHVHALTPSQIMYASTSAAPEAIHPA